MLTPKPTRRELLVLTTAAVAGRNVAVAAPVTAPVGVMLAQMFVITDQEIDDYSIALDDSWHPMQWNNDVMVSIRFVHLRASAHDVVDPNSDIELAK